MIEESYETPVPPRLELRIPSGDVEVETHDGTTTVVRVDGAENELAKTKVEQRGDTVVVDAEWARGRLAWRGRGLQVRVECPRGSALHVRSRSADVAGRGEFGSLDVASASGDTEVDSVRGDATVKTASGDVSIRRVGGSLGANSASGDIEVGAVAGALKANAVSGDIGVDSVEGDADVASVSGDVALRAVRAGTVKVNAVSGDVEVGIRSGSRVHVDASSVSGSARSEFDLSDHPGEPAGDVPTVQLRIRTVSGDISVVRAPALEPQEVQ